MRSVFFFIAVSILAQGCETSDILYPSETLQNVPVMQFVIEPDDYLTLLSSKLSNRTVPVKIFYKDSLRIGQVRSSGAGSRFDPRWSYRVFLEADQKLEGLNVFQLSAQVNDPTMLHTTIASFLYRDAGFPVFRSRHIFLKINGRDQGLYPMIEIIKPSFFEGRGLKVFELFKVGHGSKFSFTDEEYPLSSFEKEFPDDDNFHSLVEFLTAVDFASQDAFARILDIENYIAYHAMTSLLNNVDAFSNNFYLYSEDAAAAFKVVPWDFDRSFERENDVGIFGRNEIIAKIFADEDLHRRYDQQLTEFLNNSYREASIFPIIDSTAAFIEEAYNIDPYLGDGRYNFSQEVESLKSYISARILFFRENI